MLARMNKTIKTLRKPMGIKASIKVKRIPASGHTIAEVFAIRTSGYGRKFVE